jgi:hypothetical protein
VSGPWRSRGAAYHELLAAAIGAGYDVLGLDAWVDAGPPAARRVLIVRHDVDEQPASALWMARIEARLGLRTTWYFRWRTAHPAVIERLRGLGTAVGLHYETLTRAALEAGVREPTEELVERCRAELREEVAAFRARFGEMRSICPHGDSRIPTVRNLDLLRGRSPAEFDVTFDGNEVLRGRPLAAWLTDRRGGREWRAGADPLALIAAGQTPLLAVVHPHHWTSRARAGVDRALRPTAVTLGVWPWRLTGGGDEPPR